MRVPRYVNTALQSFNAWQHREVIDSVVKASDIQNAYSTLWKQPDGRRFTQYGVTITSGSYASAATANLGDKGIL